MVDNDLSRRSFLVGAGAAGLGAITVGSGTAGASETGRHVIGTSTNAATETAKQKARSVRHELDFGSIGEAVAGEFSDEALDDLEKNPNVRYVEPDIEGQIIAQTLPWGVDRVDAEVAHANSETGGDNTDGEGGADIAIVDTGIDSDHADLQANLGRGNAIVECEPLSSRPGGCGFGVQTNDNPCNESWDDDHDHGSHVSGTADAIDDSEDVVGVSTAATLHAVKVCTECGSCSQSDTAAGLEWTADQGYDAANVSLGFPEATQTLQDAVQYATNNGVFIAAAAGNDGPCTDCVNYPAKYSEVVAVSATSDDDSLADFSSTGSEIDLAAPGEDILSTTPAGTEVFSGTSMASPHVAGAAGQLMDNGYTNADARQQLKDSAEDIGLGTNDQGSGLLDVAASLGLDSSDDLGGGNSSPTVESLSLSEVETDNGDAEFDADWQVSDVDGNLDAVDLVLTDDTDGETEDSATVAVSGDTASGTTRLVAAGDDGSGNSYTVELTVTDTEGATASDTASATESEDTGSETAPTIDSFTVSTRSTGPWFRAESDWAVSDTDGDLDTVTTALLDSGGNILDSEASDISGSSASGTHEVRTRSSDADSIELTVTDAAGNSTADTRSV